MWQPGTWSDITALLGHQGESASLDFKASFGSNNELAKDIAAMTVAGGVLLVGVDEDSDGFASALTPVDLTGQEERVRQIANSLITPPPAFDIAAIREQPGTTQGVIAVIVPPSPFAPHQTNGRYPTRDGTTTRNLTDAEVALLHRRRAEATSPPTAGEMIRLVDALPGLVFERRTSVYAGYGQLSVAVTPAMPDFEHPARVNLGQPLKDALGRAGARTTPRLASPIRPRFWDAIADWRIDGTAGWVAGYAGASIEQLSRAPSHAAAVLYPAQMVMQVTFPTSVIDDHGHVAYTCAFEHRVAIELIAMLALAGEFFAATDTAGLVNCALQLAGFEGTVAHHATHAESRVDATHLPTASHGLTDGYQVAALSLRDEPEALAQQFLERWLIGFYEGAPLLGRLIG
ncbi:MAG TPA: ATP-binding protein [Thermoleophilaceae bacterium]|nr:ATP-binding protein [Thermoleophilaceae bacterium]